MEIIETSNGCGWTSTIPNQITLEFLIYIRSFARSARVLDIGTGLGVATLPALAAGAEVIALDPDRSHLSIIERSALDRKLSARLTAVQGSIPSGPQFADLDAVHCSNVLHFLRGTEIDQFVAEMYLWLKPGGTAFIQVGTAYAGHIRAMRPRFDDRLREAERWPGEVENAKDFVSPQYRDLTPDFMNYLHDTPLLDSFRRQGFRISKSWYYTRHGIPEDCVNDGREHFGIIAHKP